MKFSRIFLEILLTLPALTSADDVDVDLSHLENEFLYSKARDQLIEAEGWTDLSGLSPDELIVNGYLKQLAWREFERSRRGSEIGFPASRPLDETLANITASPLFQLLQKLPKGGNLHAHENQLIDRSDIIDILFDSEDFPYLFINTESLSLDFSTNSSFLGAEYVPLQDSNYTRQFLLQNSVFLNILDDTSRRYPTDSWHRWTQINTLWDRMSNRVLSNEKIKREILRKIYEQCAAENVLYLETRRSLTTRDDWTYVLVNATADRPNGKLYSDQPGAEAEHEIELTREIVANFSRNNTFVDHRRIVFSVRTSNERQVECDLQRVIELHRKYPDHVIAYDIVGQEDGGNAQLFFIRELLGNYDGAPTGGGNLKVPFYTHVAETDWSDDLIPSYDPTDVVSSLENIYESVLLGSRRLGHALGLLKHPKLMDEIRRRDVAIELCPASNQLLGFTPDVRNHPGRQLIAAGMPIVLGSDDPGTFGYVNFTIDWYLAYLGWGLHLGHLRKLAIDSLRYSSLHGDKLNEALVAWQAQWDQFVAETKQLACGGFAVNADDDDDDDDDAVFNRLLPREGAIDVETVVHVYGRRMTAALCANARCRFGDGGEGGVVDVEYRSQNHLVCRSKPTNVPVNVTLYVDLLGNDNWTNTTLNFRFMHLAAATVDAADTTRPSLPLAALLLTIWCTMTW